MSSVEGESARPKWLASVQSNYIPWKGYFDLIRSVDTFVLLDDVQFTRRDWRNRNKIKTKDGLRWLTIPVESKGKYLQRIDETLITDSRWAAEHWETIRHTYARAPYFNALKSTLADLYEHAATLQRLSDVNYHFITAICELLGISTPITWSTDYDLIEGKNERLINLCQQAGANHYLSGPAAKDYIDEALFAAAGITVKFADYSGYPDYDQLYPPFDHYVTVLDLIFHVGSHAALDYMKLLR